MSEKKPVSESLRKRPRIAEYDCPYRLRLGDKIVYACLAVLVLAKIIWWLL